MPELRELTNKTYDLVCGRVEELCKSVGAVFLSATATRLFFVEDLSDEGNPCVWSSTCKYFFLDYGAVGEWMKANECLAHGGTCIVSGNKPVFSIENEGTTSLGFVCIVLCMICGGVRKAAYSEREAWKGSVRPPAWVVSAVCSDL